MYDYSNLTSVFRTHLGKFFNPPDFMNGEEGLNYHTYLGHLLHEISQEGAEADCCLRVLDLVEDLHFNGDDLCRELVHVSFFENMDNLTREKVSEIRSLLPPSMKEVMDTAFVQLGYAYD